MKAVDTNVLVRFLVRDDEKQARSAYRRFRRAEADREVLFVPLLVVLETIWVLESVYGVSREEILDAVEELMMMPVLEFEALPVVQGFVADARATKTDLPDLLIGHSARISGCDHVITFDRAAAKSGLFETLR